jgi:hypothetical protein
MLLKPNFCCNCGAKIERAEWSVLTSRRFCEVCAVEFKRHEWLPRMVVIAGVLLGVFGVGIYMGGQGQPRPALLKPSENEPSRKLSVGAKQQSGIKDDERNSASPESPGTAEVRLPPDPAGAGSASVKPRVSTSAPAAQAFYCGAMTRKGKPCSRRVKTKGRCWQHEGQPSALVSPQRPDVY